VPDTPRRPFLTAEWRHLAVLNFEIDRAVLAPLLPPSCELDLWNGAALISLVGFQFLDTRVLGCAIPLHRNFDEVNVRFYVMGPQGRGVVFIREIVPKRAIALIANTLYGENYVAVPMSHETSLTSAKYAWRWRGRENFISVEMDGDSQPMVEGSADAFIFEHYWGYGRSTYQVEHPSWRTRRVTAARFEVDVDSLYGPQFGALRNPPVSAMFAEGSGVTVYRKEAAVTAIGRSGFRSGDPANPVE
jgi:uncharacterized protein YqjF (DUF2071 family)